MPICEKRKLAFCHIPRTGGVSVSNALGLTVMDKHYPASFYRKNFPEYFLFTIIRPDEERVESAKRYGEVSENFELMTRPNMFFLDAPIDHRIRFSHLEYDLNVMLRALKLEPVQLIKCNEYKKSN